MRVLLSLLMTALFMISIPAVPFAGDAPPAPDERRIEEQLKELGDELHNKLLASIRQLLDKEITRLRTGRNAVEEATRKQIASLEGILKTDPDNADAHFEAGELYDQVGDGASAIIHTHRAEQLFAAAKNAKGVAEARRELRRYYRKYDFRTEDFDLPQ